MPSTASTDVFAFTFNPAGQMTRRDEPDGTYWIYQYDNLGQVTSGKKYWSDNSPVAGQQFEYAFDDIGNRNSSASGGDASGLNLRSVSYTKNLLNQYEGRNNPSAITVIGAASTNATVTVNLSSTVRKGEYWWGEATATNVYASAYVGITNVAVIKGGGTNGTDLVSTNTGALLWPVASETFTNDLDGNLTADSLWIYTWDGENRLIRKQSQSAVPLDFRRRLEMTYDAGSRRIGQTISTWTNNAYALTKTKRFVSDGWNLLAELDASKTLVQAYVWGTDLSGSLTGAGGVGGLLMVNTGAASHGAAYNSNGDVRSLVSLTDGSQSAAYEYGPFGELVRSSGAMALANPFRFSTKHQDEESGLIYYGYRYYDARSGRWLNRDPIGEPGFRLLTTTTRKASPKHEVQSYVFVANSPINHWDYLGLDNPGCDLPSWLQPTGVNADCYRRCCAAHDQCYFSRNGTAPAGNRRCTAASWALNAGQVGGSVAGGFGGALVSLACGLHPCTGCNSDVLGCFARCATGINPPTGPEWFCPNGPSAGQYFENYDDIPASCWENGVRP